MNNVTHDEKMRAVILEYEEILIGKKRQFSSWYFSESETRNSDLAVEAFRYFFENILGWDIEAIEKNINMTLIKNFKLDKYLTNYVIFNNEPNKKPRFVAGELVQADVQELLKMVYKDGYHIDVRGGVVELYKDLVEGRIQKFPKNYFMGNDGKAKACICLQQAINDNGRFKSIEDLYGIFADRNILKLLDKWKLRDIAEMLFNTPLEYLHNSLPDSTKDEFFYNLYSNRYKEVLSTSGRTF